MTGIGHDPYRAHVPGSSRHFAQETSDPRPACGDADKASADDLAAWAATHPGGAPHVLATLDALAAV